MNFLKQHWIAIVILCLGFALGAAVGYHCGDGAASSRCQKILSEPVRCI